MDGDWDITMVRVLLMGLMGLIQTTASDYDVKMLLGDQVHVLHPGQIADLQCDFYMDYFDLFQNPIVWEKSQLTETTPINILGNILPPFISTGRFDMGFMDMSPKFKVMLSIIDLKPEDYGNYTCEIRGPQNTVMGKIVHYVYIKAPVQTISISDVDTTIHLNDIERTLEFSENHVTSLFCKSFGGCPPPEMSIYLDTKDISSDFHVEMYSRYSGKKGLRLVEHVTDRWMDDFVVTSDIDGAQLQCIVTVPGLGSNISSVKFKVIYAPVIHCEKTHASVGQKNVSLVCEVRARPSTKALFWIIDRNGTTVSPGHFTHNMWTLNMARSDGWLETRLYLREVNVDNFRTYRVVAENSIGTTEHEITLLQKHQHSSHQSVLQFPEPNPSELPYLRSCGSFLYTSYNSSYKLLFVILLFNNIIHWVLLSL